MDHFTGKIARWSGRSPRRGRTQVSNTWRGFGIGGRCLKPTTTLRPRRRTAVHLQECSHPQEAATLVKHIHGQKMLKCNDWLATCLSAPIALGNGCSEMLNLVVRCCWAWAEIEMSWIVIESSQHVTTCWPWSMDQSCMFTEVLRGWFLHPCLLTHDTSCLLTSPLWVLCDLCFDHKHWHFLERHCTVAVPMHLLHKSSSMLLKHAWFLKWGVPWTPAVETGGRESRIL